MTDQTNYSILDRKVVLAMGKNSIGDVFTKVKL